MRERSGYPTTLQKIQEFDTDPETVLEYGENLDRGIQMTREKWTVIAAIIWIEECEYDEEPWVEISGELWNKIRRRIPLANKNTMKKAVEEVYKNELLYDESDHGYRKKQRAQANGISFEDLRALIAFEKKNPHQDSFSAFE